MRRTVPISVLVLTAALAVPGLAQAAEGGSQALAETLFQEGWRLREGGHIAEACGKFAESLRLERATGTLLNLADCREREGRLATAWALFSEGRLAAQQDGRADRADFARQREQALVGRLSRLTIVVAEVPEGYVVLLDGAVLRSPSYGVGLPVDGGLHHVEARAPGHVSWRGTIQVPLERGNEVLSIPPLEAEAVAGESAQSAAPADPGGERPVPASVYWLGGAALVFGAATVGTGVAALTARSDYEAANNDPAVSVGERQQMYDDWERMAWLATGLGVAAGASALAGAYLYVSRPTVDERVSFVLRPTLAGAWLGCEGTWH